MVDANNPKESSKGRAGSRKIRVYVFREWLLETYGSYLSRGMGLDESVGTADGEDERDHGKKRKRKRKRNRGSSVILDVAGGKGDLSWLLKNVDGLESIVLDPWKPDPNAVSRNERMVRSIEYLRKNPSEARNRSVPFLPTYQPLAELLPVLLEGRKRRLLLRTQQTNEAAPQNSGDDHKGPNASLPPSARSLQHADGSESGFLDSLASNDNDGPCRPEDFLTPRVLHVPLDERMVQKVRNRLLAANEETWTGNDGGSGGSGGDGTQEEDDILELLSSGRIKLIVGFHPDQATEPCIDLARVLGIPYCVVPCCVFPSEFQNRYLRLPSSPSPLPSRFEATEEENDSSSSSSINNNNNMDANNSNKQEEKLIPVKTYHQFLDYLRQKATSPIPLTSGVGLDGDDTRSNSIHTSYLNFPFTETAKNIVLYSLPPSN